MKLPSQEYLRNILTYDPESGRLHWLPRHASSFSSDRACNAWNARFAGKEAFTAVTTTGYRTGGFDGRMWFAHRVIWKLVHGEEPDLIDHVDGRKLDNRLANLRSVSSSANLRNQKRKRTASGAVGVYWNKPAAKWVAQIRVAEISKSKAFASLEDAVAWRKAMERKLGFTERHGQAVVAALNEGAGVPA